MIPRIKGTRLAGSGISIRRVSSEARRGDPDARMLLGRHYLEQSGGIRRKADRGIRLLEASASDGSIAAMLALSTHYRGAGDDPEKAHGWALRAAEAGDPDAEMQVGFDHRNGYSVDRDDSMAEMWLERAASHGNVDALAFLGNLHVTSDDPDVADTPLGLSQLAEASDRGSARASFFLGLFYRGYGDVDDNLFQSYRMIRRAASQGDPDGMLVLGMMHMEGTPYVERDREEAFRLYRSSYDGGCRDAATFLGTAYLFGLGTEEDHQKALGLLEEGVGAGSPIAMINLAMMFSNGIAVATDHSRAAALYRRAADLGSPKAMSNLGVMYATGRGVERDPVEARRLLEAARDLGDECAERNLRALDAGATEVRSEVVDCGRAVSVEVGDAGTGSDTTFTR